MSDEQRDARWQVGDVFVFVSSLRVSYKYRGVKGIITRICSDSHLEIITEYGDRLFTWAELIKRL